MEHWRKKQNNSKQNSQFMDESQRISQNESCEKKTKEF
jgi:hypothetical protein